MMRYKFKVQECPWERNGGPFRPSRPGAVQAGPGGGIVQGCRPLGAQTAGAQMGATPRKRWNLDSCAKGGASRRNRSSGGCHAAIPIGSRTKGSDAASSGLP